VNVQAWPSHEKEENDSRATNEDASPHTGEREKGRDSWKKKDNSDGKEGKGGGNRLSGRGLVGAGKKGLAITRKERDENRPTRSADEGGRGNHPDVHRERHKEKRGEE